ncbi:MAG: hypothetical protein ACMXYF_03370 [Candidatus Woesearchaeota archaeon]
MKTSTKIIIITLLLIFALLVFYSALGLDLFIDSIPVLVFIFIVGALIIQSKMNRKKIEVTEQKQFIFKKHGFEQGFALTADSLIKKSFVNEELIKKHNHYNNKQKHLLYFDAEYIVGSGRNANTVFKATLLSYKKKERPWIFLRKENFGDKLKRAIGFDNIHLQSQPEFSKNFFIEGANPKKIEEYLTPERIHNLQRLNCENIKIELFSDAIIVQDHRTYKNADQFQKQLEKLQAIIQACD